MDVTCAADESYPEDQWCIPQDVELLQDVERKSYYRISQRPRSSCSVSELLQPCVALASTVGTSYRKTIMTQPQTRNSYCIDRRAGQQVCYRAKQKTTN